LAWKDFDEYFFSAQPIVIKVQPGPADGMFQELGKVLLEGSRTKVPCSAWVEPCNAPAGILRSDYIPHQLVELAVAYASYYPWCIPPCH